jgi:TetR/AcrR family transcriptional regulator
MPRRKMVEEDVHAVRARLLVAARRRYRQGGIDALGMGDVAREAHVARSTVYRYFASREDLLTTLLRDEIDASAVVLARALERVRDPAQRIVEGLVVALRELPRRKLLMDLLVGDRPSLRRSIVWSSESMIGLGRDFLRAVFEPSRARGLLRDDLGEGVLAEWIYRTLLSFLMLPSRWSRDERQLRRVLRHLLVPALLRPAPAARPRPRRRRRSPAGRSRPARGGTRHRRGRGRGSASRAPSPGRAGVHRSSARGG